ncbi:GntR family transcriptional regulator [Bosea sp. (in: a-proteobacteria)]|uniref:GntR family transcriptional regulator n=1 Tax=Bosea sp. (in: a-proteobacteria) TaxID=1871050 RepID=UPI002611EC55|nr:GntR family transcriptional regulator [Bosea sp. (in: a-proteobacteria)]MCO5093127.1 GntR family transcriptional regulator [Bosea sp. (in: a-proteobacteria)]
MAGRAARSNTTGQSRSDYVYGQIRAGLRRGDIKPGQRLLEADLAQQLNVSRTPIRDAIRRLISEGLVTIAPSRGVMVIELSKQQVREIYALREVLEGAAARLAAQFATKEELAILRQALESSANIVEPARYADFNTVFHQAIHDAAHNQYLALALNQLANSLALLPGTTFQAPGRLPVAKQEHMAMLEAIESRDQDLAELLARKHIRQAHMTRANMMFASSWQDSRTAAADN